MIPVLTAPDYWAFWVGVGLFIIFARWCWEYDRLSAVMFCALLVQYTVLMLAQTYKYNTHLIYNNVTGQLMSWGFGMIWISHLFGPAGYRFARTPLTLFAGSYIILTLLATLYAPTRVWFSTVETAIKFSSAVLTYFAVVQFISTRRRWNTMLYLIFAITVICWVYGLMQYKGYDPLYKGDERTIFSFLGNKSFYGSWQAYTVPLALYVSQSFASPWRYAAFAICATLGVFNLYLADTRSAWLAFGLFIVMALGFEVWRGRLAGRLKDAAFCLKFAAGVLVFLAAAWALAPDHLKNKLETVGQTKKGTNAVRWYMWKGSVEMMLDRPLIGQGTGTFEQLFLYFRDDQFHRKGIQYGSRQAHSEPMEILAEQGLIGFTAWLAMLAALFYAGIRRLSREKELGERILLFGLLAALASGIVNDAIQPTMRILNHATTFWVLMALTSRYLGGFDSADEKRRLRTSPGLGSPSIRIVVCAVMAVIFGVMVMGHMRWMRSDKYYWRTGAVKTGAEYNNLARKLLELQPYSLRTLFGLTHYNADFTVTDVGEKAANRLCALSPGQVLGHRNLYTGLMLRYQKERNPVTLWQALEHLEYTTLLDNSLDYQLPLAHLYREHDRPQRALYHARFVIREISDEWAEEIMRHPSRIALKPGQRDTMYNELEGKGEYSYYPTRFLKGLDTYYRLRIALEAVLGYDEARDSYISFQVAQRRPQENLWLRRAFRHPDGRPIAIGSNRRLAYSLGFLERAAIKGREWPDDQRQELLYEVQELQAYLDKTPSDHLRIYMMGAALMNLGHPKAADILKVSAAQAASHAPWLQSRYQRLMAHKGVGA